MIDSKSKMEAWSAELEGRLQQTFSTLEGRCQIQLDSQKKLLQEAEQRILRTGVAGGAGTGPKAGSTKLTTKDVKVEKLVEEASLLDFRKWQKTIEFQLEHVFGKCHVEDLILGILKIRTPIDADIWAK